MHWGGKHYLKQATAVKDRLDKLMGDEAKQMTFEVARKVANQMK